jgi:hypothetical protein
MSDKTEVLTSQERAPKPAAGGLAALPGAVAQPMARAGRSLYDGVAGTVERYLEKWEDVVYEAKAEREPAPAPDVNSILAALPGAKTVSEAPGRVRLSVGLLKRQDQLAYEVVEALSQVPGVRRIEASSITGTVLITYSTRTYPSLDALRQKLAKG